MQITITHYTHAGDRRIARSSWAAFAARNAHFGSAKLAHIEAALMAGRRYLCDDLVAGAANLGQGAATLQRREG